MTLNHHDRRLLVELRKGNHLKANPGDIRVILHAKFPEITEPEMLASYRRLTVEGLARNVMDSSRPGALLLRMSDTGMATADQLMEDEREPTWRERVAAIPVGKGVWDLIKIGLGFVLGLLTHQLTGS